MTLLGLALGLALETALFTGLLGALGRVTVPPPLDAGTSFSPSTLAQDGVPVVFCGAGLLALAAWSGELAAAVPVLALAAYPVGGFLARRRPGRVSTATQTGRWLLDAPLLLGLGALLDLSILVAYVPLVVATAAGVLMLRGGVGVLVARLAGRRGVQALAWGLAAAPLGELALVLAVGGRAAGLAPLESAALGEPLLVATVVLLRLAAPGLDALERRLVRAAGLPAGPLPAGAPRPALPVLYGTAWCPLTGGLRVYLRERGIPYRYRDVEADPAAAAELRDLQGGALRFPVVCVGAQVLTTPSIDALAAALGAGEASAAR